MKRFISNEDLVRKFFVEALAEKEVLRHLLVIVSLVKLYGHKLNITEWYLALINKEYPDIGKLYALLHSLGKTNLSDLNAIVKICKRTYTQHRMEFTVSADAATQGVLSEYIEKHFDTCDITCMEAPVLGIDLKWEGYRYHRNIDTDLHAILDH